jgi:hypothetical protein
VTNVIEKRTLKENADKGGKDFPTKESSPNVEHKNAACRDNCCYRGRNCDGILYLQRHNEEHVSTKSGTIDRNLAKKHLKN